MAEQEQLKSHNAPHGPCSVCGAANGQPCSRCRLDYYCGKAHQKQDWKRHSQGCGVVEVRADPVLGRHLVAAKDIPAGTVVLRELPLLTVVPPWTTEWEGCVGCFADTSNAIGRATHCRSCNWPMCGKDCTLKDIHKAECAAFKRAGSKLSSSSRSKIGPLLWTALSALRTHLALQRQPKLLGLQALHKEPLETAQAPGVSLRAGPGGLRPVLGVADAANWRTYEDAATRQRQHWPAAARWLRGVAGLTWIPEEELVRAAGINDINAVNVNPMEIGPTAQGRGSFLFAGVSLLEHCCAPSCLLQAHNPDSPSYEQVVMTARDVRRGEHLSRDYLDTAFQGAVTRRALLRRGWSFVCACERCADPTAAGVYLGSPCCSRCKGEGRQSWMLAQADGEGAGPVRWRCQDCGLEADNVSVAEQEARLLALRVGAAGLDEYAAALRSMVHPRGPLHQRHQLVLNCTTSGLLKVGILIQLGQSFDEAAYVRWFQQCQAVLAAADAVKPGLCHMKSNIRFVAFQLVLVILEKVVTRCAAGSPDAMMKEMLPWMVWLRRTMRLVQPYYVGFERRAYFQSVFAEPADAYLQGLPEDKFPA